PAARVVDWISVPLGVATLREQFDDVRDDAARFALMSWFFEENLADFVDVTQENWAWKGGLGSVGESTTSLAQFQRAAEIQEAFFPSGSTRPEVTLDFRIEDLSENATVAIIIVNGQRSIHGIDGVPPRSMIWPGDDNAQESRLLIRPGEYLQSLAARGEWSPFRLIETGRIEPISENTFRVTLASTGHTATFRVTTNSVNNPFQLAALDTFSCPPDL
ncbi:MAG: type VI secretion IcmF C-terminal domain-containing protein, partial [Pseudomonadota bacterium]